MSVYHGQFVWQWREAHPLIRGLFELLPERGSAWSQNDREQWLEAAEGVFGLLFTEGGTSNA